MIQLNLLIISENFDIFILDNFRHVSRVGRGLEDEKTIHSHANTHQ